MRLAVDRAPVSLEEFVLDGVRSAGLITPNTWPLSTIRREVYAMSACSRGKESRRRRFGWQTP